MIGLYSHPASALHSRSVMGTLPLRIRRGRSLPLGATALADGINFVLLCRHGTAVSLVIYPLDGTEPLAEVALHPRRHRTGDHWHIQIGGMPPVFGYGWGVDGPRGRRHRFDPSMVLLDPAATALSNGAVWGEGDKETRRQGDKETAKPTERRSWAPRTKKRRFNASLFFRKPFSWQEDGPPLTPLEDTIIYELHVRGLDRKSVV